MNGFRTLCISFSILLLGVYYPANAQNLGIVDTLKTAVVSASRSPIVFTGLKHIDNKELVGGTALLGSPDVVKVLQNFPGVASGMELSSGLYVHGGDGSDNQFLLDGVPLFQVSHLAGLFSSFNTDIIKSVDFYKSGFPAQYGGRLSSIIDISTKDGSVDDFGGSFSVGLIDGRLFVNGPIVKGKLSYSLALRRSWLDCLLAPIIAFGNSGSPTQTQGKYVFYDTNIGLTYIPNLNDRINFRFYSGSDSFLYGKSVEEKFYGKEIYYANSAVGLETQWGNYAVSSNWTHSFSPKSQIHTVLYFSKGYSNVYDSQKTNDFLNEKLTTCKLEESINGSANATGIYCNYSLAFDHHNLCMGLGFQKAWFSPLREIKNTSGGDVDSFASEDVSYYADKAAMYVEDEVDYGALGFTAGIRLEGYLAEGSFHLYPQPRFSVNYYLTNNLIVKASYETTSQFEHLLSSIYIDLPTNIWMPSTQKIKPLDSRQIVVGLFSSFSKKWKMDISGYYRHMNNCLIYSNSGSLFPPVDRWEEDFLCGEGRAYGTELELHYLSDKFTGTMYYTLSWSERKFDDLYYDWFQDRFDNRHKITLLGSYEISDNIDVKAVWNYHSGNRVTVPEHIVYYSGGGSEFLFSHPYNAKIPDYHRLDVSVNFHKETGHGNESVWNISLYNAYCRMNPILMLTERNVNDEPIAVTYSRVPLIPSFSYTLNF